MRKPWQVAAWWVASSMVIWVISGLFWWLDNNSGRYIDDDFDWRIAALGSALCGTLIVHCLIVSWWRGGGTDWLISTCVGCVAGAVMTSPFQELSSCTISPSRACSLSSTILVMGVVGIFGLATGKMQWIGLFRKWGPALWWWIVTSAIGWIGACMVLISVPSQSLYAMIGVAAGDTLSFGIIGTTHALITGAAIYRIAHILQQQPAPTERA